MLRSIGKQSVESGAKIPRRYAQRIDAPGAELALAAAAVSGPPTMLTTWSKVDVMPPRRPRLASRIDPNSFDEPSVMRDLSALVASSTD